jgi:hypothetical protein
MPTKKQRRRRAKEQRHEYEVVYLDAEGNEVEVDADEVDSRPGQRRDDRGDRKQPAGRASRRGVQPPDPPTWRRSARRSLILAPFFFAFLLIIQRNLASAIIVGLFYAAVFVPFSYGIDKLVYRNQLKRLERR